MADSATYTPETLQRRYAMAQALLAPNKEPIRHWAQGLNELAQGALGGYQLGNTERLEAKQRGDANAQVMAALGLGGQTPAAPSALPMQPAPAGGAPAAVPDRIVGAESGGVPTATNPNSTAAGPGQFIDSTWLETLKKNRPDLAAGKDDAALLAMRTDPAQAGLSRDMTDAYAKQNSGTLAAAGLPVTPGTTYLAHFAGPTGATKILSADPATPVSGLLSPAAIQANPQIANMSAGDLRAWADKKMGGGAPGASPAVGAIASALNGGSSGAPTAGAGAPPGPAVADVAKTLSSPAGAPGAAPAAPLAGPAGVGANPNAKAIAAVLTSPWIDPSVKQAVIAQSSPSFGFQTLPDGTIIRTNPKTGQVEPVYQAATKPTFGQTGESAFGDKQFGFIDPVAKTITPANGVAAGGGVAGVPDSGFMAKGVTAVDHELKGPDYLNQFSPEVKSAVQNMVDGNSMPTGNPRKGFTQAVKMIAQKYGSDVGVPMDDASFGQRRTMLNNLAVSTPGSLGGQINFAGTSLEHLATTAEKIGELNNVNGLGIAPVARLANSARQLTTEQAGKANAVTGAAQHYGQEVTKFYSGSPGGEAERSRFMNTLSTSKSPTELADALQTERDLIPGRLEQVATQIKTTFGENSPQVKKYLTRIEEAQKAIPRIDAAIGKLRGEGVGTPSAATLPATAPKTPAAGEVRSGYRFKGGNPADKANWEQVQ